MPLLHCNKCHHEWEGDDEDCSWCGSGPAYVLEEETALDKLMNNFTEVMKKLLKGEKS